MRWVLVAAAAGLAVCAGWACGDDGGGGAGGGGGSGGAWSVVLKDQDAAFYSAWAPAPDDVWVVGTDPGDGPWVLRFDGTGWDRLSTGTSGSLRWIHGFPGGPVFLGGDGGVVLRTQDGSSFERLDTPGTRTVWGVWGAAPDDVWAVGGDPGGTGAFAWRLDGDSFREADGFPVDVASAHAAFKVWGRAGGDVWIVGTGGLVLHFDGEGFTRQGEGTLPADIDLRTVHGGSSRLLLVGGYANGFAASSAGDGAWAREFPVDAILPALNGVFVAGDRAVAVGMEGFVVEHRGGSWHREAEGLTRRGLHGVAVDPAGGVWAVGGRLESDAGGTILHRGGPVSGTVR